MDKLPRLDKNVISITSLNDIEEEKKFWLSKGSKERIEAIELNRRMVYGKNRIASRLQRFLETSELTQR
ncbi:MAG: hypothetical protein JRC57_05640 [Deltaproteobacteria bacterium]|jgi:hypothetical protein|nr:hypothetical protein [Deltaproteobacteria bacterium]